ncbi:hypothetical protein EDB19DRAFT_1836059 [Suillus lakei]|nr:hypothetical protein EDB19DRAFT_1836059 [Suillus lakei]
MSNIPGFTECLSPTSNLTTFDLADMANIFEFTASRLLAIRRALANTTLVTSAKVHLIVTKYLMWEGESPFSEFTHIRWTAKGDNVPIEAGQPMLAHGNNCTMLDEWAEGSVYLMQLDGPVMSGPVYEVLRRQMGGPVHQGQWTRMSRGIGCAMETAGPVPEVHKADRWAGTCGSQHRWVGQYYLVDEGNNIWYMQNIPIDM